MERVVVTGMGVVSCVGSGLNAFWSALTEGRSGIDRITAYDPAPYRTQIAGEVRDFKYHPKESKRLARYSQLAMGAADEAMAMAGLPDGLADPTRAGVSVGTGIAGLPFLMQQYERFLAGNPGRVHPLTIPIIIPNMGAANISMKYGARGPESRTRVGLYHRQSLDRLSAGSAPLRPGGCDGRRRGRGHHAPLRCAGLHQPEGAVAAQ